MSARPFKLKLENEDRKIGIMISSLKELEKESIDRRFIATSEKKTFRIDWTLEEDGTIAHSVIFSPIFRHIRFLVILEPCLF